MILRKGETRAWELLERAGRIAAAVAIVVLLGAVARMRSTVTRMAEVQALARDLIYKDNLRAALFGRRIPLEYLVTVDGAEVTDDRLEGVSAIWIFDPAACTECVHFVQEWNRSVLPGFPRAATILSGVRVDEAQRVAKSLGLKTVVLVDSTQGIRKRFGLRSPSTYLVVDARGEIIHLDWRSADRSCARDVLDFAQRISPSPFLATPQRKEAMS
ncbi:MAG TPA: hypothetical protein VF158_13475 [Longimicrobiales bacterium]